MILIRFITVFFLLTSHLIGQQNLNYIQINNTDNYNDLAVLDTVVPNFNFYFSGENHMFSTTNSQLEFKLLSYLNQRENVTNFLLEFGYGTGWLVNDYVNNNNPKVDSIVELYFNEDFIKLFKSVRTYNNKLKDSTKKIKVSGIDLQRSFELTFEILTLQLPNERILIHDSIKREVDLLRYMQGYIRAKSKAVRNYGDNVYTKYDLYNVVKKMETNYTKHKHLYEDYIGNNYSVFDRTMKALFKTKKWKEEEAKLTPYATIFREQALFDNLESLVESKPGEKFYGQFGRAHIAQKRYTKQAFSMYNFAPFISKINQSDNPYFKNKVLSIGVFYTNSDGKESYSIYQEKDIQKAFSGLEKDCVIIAKTNDFESLDSLTKDHYQYIIVNNNSLFKEANGSYKETYYGFSPTVGFHSLDIAKTNSIFGTSLNNSITRVGGSYYFFEDFGFYVDFNGNYAFAPKQTISDSSSGKFSLWNVGLSFGGDIIKSRNVHLIPSLSLMYQSAEMNIEQTQQTAFSEINTIHYSFKNPSFVVGLNLDIRIQLFLKTSLTIKGGINLATLNSKWRYEKQPLDMKNNLSGFYTVAGLAFDID